MTPRNGFIAGFLACYLFCGISIGLALKNAIPASTYFGAAFIAAIWPAWVSAPVTGIDIPVPCISFRFGDGYHCSESWWFNAGRALASGGKHDAT